MEVVGQNISGSGAPIEQNQCTQTRNNSNDEVSVVQAVDLGAETSDHAPFKNFDTNVSAKSSYHIRGMQIDTSLMETIFPPQQKTFQKDGKLKESLHVASISNIHFAKDDPSVRALLISKT